MKQSYDFFLLVVYELQSLTFVRLHTNVANLAKARLGTELVQVLFAEELVNETHGLVLLLVYNFGIYFGC